MRSACLLILVFLFFTAGFVGLVSAKVDDYNYSKLNNSSLWGTVRLPETEYPIWGYTTQNYNFFVNHTVSPNDPSNSNTTMVFYWDCLNNSANYHDNSSDYSSFSLDNRSHFDNDSKKWKCTHRWNNTGNYSVAVGIFKLNSRGEWEGKNVSYWIPVEIKNNTPIIVQNFSMLDEKEGFDSNNSAHIYKISNFSKLMLGGEEEFNCSNSTYYNLDNSSKNCCYCGYKDNDYSFSTCLNATCGKSENISALPETDIRTPTRADIQNLLETDTRTIMETTTVIKWDNNSSDNSIFGNISYSNETEDDALVVSDNNVSIKSDNINTSYIQWNENFTHEWDDTGIKTINATSFHWDPFDGIENYSNYKNKSILIISDPKNLAPYPLIGNLQNWGILLSILGLVIFYFTYTRNNVPIKIALFGMKPFYLKSVNSLTGTLIFVAGMYLCFVFGRCPWDIPIVSSSNWLSNMYFNMLYHEYVTKPRFYIPYLSILIGMLYVIILSLIIHLIAIPFYKGEFKIGEFLRRKLSSTSTHPELVSYSVENKINQDN